MKPRPTGAFRFRGFWRFPSGKLLASTNSRTGALGLLCGAREGAYDRYAPGVFTASGVAVATTVDIDWYLDSGLPQALGVQLPAPTPAEADAHGIYAYLVLSENQL